MLKIRLRRMGSTHSPFYRVVVSDSRRTPRASVLEEVGHYNPIADPVEIRIDSDRVEYWVEKGAQMSPTVKRLIRRQANPAAVAAAPPVAEAEEEPAAADAENVEEVAEVVEAEVAADAEEAAEAVEDESAPETAES